MNVVSMNHAQFAARGGLSALSLQFEVVDDRLDWPVVRILVDGQDPFAPVAPGWRGFDPVEILGPRSPWNLPDLHFDREQDIAEIERASRNGSWETDRRKTARLLYERLEPLGLTLPPDLRLAWGSTAWCEDGVTLMFQRIDNAPRPKVRQQMLWLTSTLDGPDQAAEDMAQRLLSTPADDWAESFGQQAPWSRQ